MALKNCKECGNEVSTTAMSCPNCGSVLKKKSGCLGYIGAGFLVFIILGVIGSLIEDDSDFRQVGYFKDELKNRIFAVAYRAGTPEREIRYYAVSLMHTSGQMTAAYFYSEGSLIPSDGVTLAGSMFEVNDLLYETPGLSKWRYAYMRYFNNGASEFVDCVQDPGNGLCSGK